jgi:hypothetical protein
MKKCLLMGMDSSMVQLDGVVNEKNMEIIRRYHEGINAKQRELQSQHHMANINVKLILILLNNNYPHLMIKDNIGKCQFPLPCPTSDQFPRPFGNSLHTDMGINTPIDSSLQV